MHTSPFVGWAALFLLPCGFLLRPAHPSLDPKPGEASQDFLLNPPHIHTDTLNCHDHDAGLQLECIPIDT